MASLLVLLQVKKVGVQNILALRGDPPKVGAAGVPWFGVGWGRERDMPVDEWASEEWDRPH